MNDDESLRTLRPVNADDFQQGWLVGWLHAQGHSGPVEEALFIEAVRAWQHWLAANAQDGR